MKSIPIPNQIYESEYYRILQNDQKACLSRIFPLNYISFEFLIQNCIDPFTA